jgi:hypothetical protein
MSTVSLVLFAALLVLTACCAAPLPDPPPTSPVAGAPAPAAIVATPAVHAASVAVVRRFDAAKADEIGVVFGSEVTREQIQAIRVADHAARRALTALGLQRDHVTLAALNAARTAVRALEDALESPKPATEDPNEHP